MNRLSTSHVFTLSGTSQASAAFGGQTWRVRIATGTQPAWFAVGASPEATTTASHLIGAACIDYIYVRPSEKVAVLQAGTAGSISITEVV